MASLAQRFRGAYWSEWCYGGKLDQRCDPCGGAEHPTELNFWIELQRRPELLRQLRTNGRVPAFPTQYTTSRGEIKDAEVWVELIALEGQPACSPFKDIPSSLNMSVKGQNGGQISSGD